jgi:hypothetical protein
MIKSQAGPFDSRAFLKLIRRHVEAEVAGDVDGVMATICRDPHFELHPPGFVIQGSGAVREMYRRVLPLFKFMLPGPDSGTWDETDKTRFIGPMGVVTRDSGTYVGDGQNFPFTGLAWFVPDYPTGLLKGERIYMNSLLSVVLTKTLREDFLAIDGVSLER